MLVELCRLWTSELFLANRPLSYVSVRWRGLFLELFLLLFEAPLEN